MKAKIEAHIQAVRTLMAATPLLERVADVIVECFERGNRLYLLGNGGSAADAQHIAAEFVGRFKLERAPLPAIALTTDTSALTAIGNDYGGNEVFRRQMAALVKPGDVVWALSVSGSSANVLAALEVAAEREAIIVGFTSRTGDKLAAMCRHCLRADHTDSDRVQEVHVLAYHLICERVEAHFAASDGIANSQPSRCKEATA